MVKNLSAMRRLEFNPWVGKVPWRRERLPTPVFLPGEFYGQRSLAGSQRVRNQNTINFSSTVRETERQWRNSAGKRLPTWKYIAHQSAYQELGHVQTHKELKIVTMTLS